MPTNEFYIWANIQCPHMRVGASHNVHDLAVHHIWHSMASLLPWVNRLFSPVSPLAPPKQLSQALLLCPQSLVNIPSAFKFYDSSRGIFHYSLFIIIIYGMHCMWCSIHTVFNAHLSIWAPSVLCMPYKGGTILMATMQWLWRTHNLGVYNDIHYPICNSYLKACSILYT